MASEFTIDIQLTELGFHHIPAFNEELPIKETSQNNSSCNPPNPPAPPERSESPPEPPPEPLESPPAPAKPPQSTSKAPLATSNPTHPSTSKSAPAPSQPTPPVMNSPKTTPPVINPPLDHRLLSVVQQNIHTLPKNLPMAIVPKNLPMAIVPQSGLWTLPSQSTPVMVANIQPQSPQFITVVNKGIVPEKESSTESNAKKESKQSNTKKQSKPTDAEKEPDLLTDDVVVTKQTLALGEKKDDDGKSVSTEKTAFVVRYTDGEQSSAEKKNTAQEVVPEKDGAESQNDANVRQSRANTAQDESDDSEVSEVEEEEEEEEDTDDEDDGQLFAPDAGGEHSCSVCHQTFTNGFLLREHMHLHTGVRPYRCAECGKQFCHLANYRAHLRTHAQAVPIRCRVCQANFETEKQLQQHLESTHFESEFYQCDYCKRIFTCMNDCLLHVQKHKSEVAQPQCAKCGRRFRHEKSLRRHLLKRACQRAFLCSDCGQSFRKKNTLLRHSFSHLGLLPYTCTHCKTHFRLANLYRKHKCKPETIQCVACLSTFASHGDFERALAGVRAALAVLQQQRRDEIRCMECGQTFSAADELKKHAGSHQRVLKCAECGMGFRSALMLMSHMGGHAGQRPCLCQKCGLGFPHQQGYDLHLKDCGVIPPPKVKKTKPAPKKTAKKSHTIAPKDTTPTPPQSKVKETNTVNVPQTHPPEPAMPAVPAMPGQPAEGAWQLRLDKTPPPNTPLVVFLPMSAPVPSNLTVSTAEPQTLVLTDQNSVAASLQPPQTQDSRANMVPNPVLEAAVLDKTAAPLAFPCEQQQLQKLPQPCLNTPVIKKEPEIPGYSEACISSCFGNICDVTSTVQVKKEERGPKSDEVWVSEEKWTTLKGEIKLKDEFKSSDLKTEIQLEDLRLPAVIKKSDAFGDDSGQHLERSNLLMSDVNISSSENLEQSHLLITDVRSESRVEDCFKSTGERTRQGETETSSQAPGHLDSPLDLRLTVNHSDRSPEAQSEENTIGKVNGETVAQGHSRHELEANKKVTEDSYFTSVEVDLRDEHRDEDEEEEGEPHECVTCGKIILEGDLIEHYMEHAMQGDQDLAKSPTLPPSPAGSLLSSTSSYSPSVSAFSSPNATPPASPPSKRLRSSVK
ncbi:uncharacterized protein wu:fe05a04 [Alosa alosa]|nr:uncharacterized protein wu:fe05a04 [Alosa alosa]